MNMSLDIAKIDKPYLDAREKVVLFLRQGLVNNYTLEEVGKLLNITRERVRQIEAKALEKLRLL